METTSQNDSFWKQHSVRVTVFGLIGLIILCFGLFELGFRIAPGVTIERIGTLSVTGAPKGTSVFVDGVLSRTTQNANEINVELVPGTHTVIVAAPGKYPWPINAVIKSGKKTTISPLLVNSSNTTIGKLLTGDAKARALAAIASSTLPSATAPITLTHSCSTVYVQNNQIIQTPASTTPTCTPPPYLCVGGSCKSTIVFAPIPPVDALFPYPGREDAVIILLDHSLFALSLDPESQQFFAPIAHAHLPKAGMLPDGSIVMEEDGNVYQVTI